MKQNARHTILSLKQDMTYIYATKFYFALGDSVCSSHASNDCHWLEPVLLKKKPSTLTSNLEKTNSSFEFKIKVSFNQLILIFPYRFY